MRYSIILLFLLGCTSKEPLPAIRVTDYLPLHRGIYQVYSVDSTVIRQNVETTYNFELKTIVTDSFPNAGGGYTYKIQRSKRITTGSPWTALETWSARSETYQAVVNEGNISFVKMSGPLVNGKAWNGNSLNILGGQEKCLDRDSHACDIYTIDQFAMPYTTTTGESFDNTVTVIENDNQDLIVSQDKRTEIYARATGLIYRETISLQYCTGPGCAGTQTIDKGLRYRQTITAYGEM